MKDDKIFKTELKREPIVEVTKGIKDRALEVSEKGNTTGYIRIPKRDLTTSYYFCCKKSSGIKKFKYIPGGEGLVRKNYRCKIENNHSS